ncbi:MAG: alanine--tRNA ligase, partial [Chloroflexi bacterium]|nr:alanine--tRNA ligase [Chloroflexota bacterium]
LIADGIVPSNEKQGYVLRSVLRRAVRFGLSLGLREPFLGQVAEAVIEKLGPYYPELARNRDFVQRVLRTEEEGFHQTLERGLPLIHEIVRQKKEAPPGHDTFLRPVGRGEIEVIPSLSSESNVIPAQNAFVLHGTYGITIDIIQDEAAEHNLQVDRAGFEEMLKADQLQSRAASAALFGTGAAAAEALAALGLPPTGFVGYQALSAGSEQTLEHPSTIVALLVGGQPADAVEDGQEAQAILMETPFYPEGGGQVGDAGEIAGEQGSLLVEDTQRPGGGVIVHRGKARGRLSVGDAVLARVDAARRADIMRNHTATHLLHAALRQVLGEHAAQAGSLVAPDRLRFDFSHLAPLSPEELRRVEELVNEKVLADLRVRPQETTYAQALAQGALAFFGEKYGDKVRVVEVCETPATTDAPCERAFSKELCGGTHCTATGQVGLFQIVSESSIGAGVRRIEAVTGRAAQGLVRRRLEALEAIARHLRTAPDRAAEKVASLAAELEQERRRSLSLERELLKSTMDSLLSKAQRVGEVRVVAARVPAGSPEALRQMGDWLRDQLGSAVIVLGAVANERPQFVAVVTPDLVAKGYHAGEILKAVAAIAGGGGGGRPDMAQAGGKDKSKLDEALRLVEKLVRERARPQP